MPDISPADRQIMEAAPDAILVMNASGEMVLVNSQTESMFGYTRDELQGRPVDTLIPGSLTMSDVGDCRMIGRHKDASEFPLETRSSLLNVGNGTFLICSMRDATNRRQLEESLGEILATSLNEMYVFDAATLRFVEANEAARENLGFSLRELRQLTPCDLTPDLTVQAFEALVRPLQAREIESRKFETNHRRKDGSTYPAEVYFRCSQMGGTDVVVAVIQDLAARRTSVQTTGVPASDALADTLLESLRGIVLLLDKNGRILRWNRYLEDLTGFSADEVIGGNWFEIFIPADQRSHIAKVFDGVLCSDVTDAHINTILTKSGERRIVEWYSTTVPGSGGEAGRVLCTGHDVTERESANRELEHARDEAQKATESKSRFLAAASHDLRQPLQSLGLYLSVLMRALEKSPLDKSPLLNVSEKMQRNLDTMRELLDALLDISKLDGGSVKPDKQDFPLQPLLDRIHADNVQQAAEKGLHLHCDQTELIVHSDPGLLERVLENFVTNAVRYTEQGRVDVTCACADGVAQISVADTGIGIAKNDLDSVFDEYYQLDTDVRGQRHGLGLGLSIVQHIARLLEHDVGVDSTPGHGSTFRISVPLGKTPQPFLATDHAHGDVRTGASHPIVLVVDDDPAILDATTMVLQSSGVKVHSASCGAEVLAHIAAGVRPDVVVADYRLPGDNGIAVIRQVRELLGRDVPVVLMTGDTSAAEIKAARLRDCTVLHKPVDTARLLSLIDGADD